jgi:hypothetical protein
MDEFGTLQGCRFLLHDRDTKYTQSFRAIITSGQVEPFTLPARSPNLNAYAERWVRSAKEECLSKLILFGEQLLEASAERICYPFPWRAEPSRQRQRLAVPTGSRNASHA